LNFSSNGSSKRSSAFGSHIPLVSHRLKRVAAFLLVVLATLASIIHLTLSPLPFDSITLSEAVDEETSEQGEEEGDEGGSTNRYKLETIGPPSMVPLTPKGTGPLRGPFGSEMALEEKPLLKRIRTTQANIKCKHLPFSVPSRADLMDRLKDRRREIAGVLDLIRRGFQKVVRGNSTPPSSCTHRAETVKNGIDGKDGAPGQRGAVTECHSPFPTLPSQIGPTGPPGRNGIPGRDGAPGLNGIQGRPGGAIHLFPPAQK
jgi:hypothetical protein